MYKRFRVGSDEIVFHMSEENEDRKRLFHKRWWLTWYSADERAKAHLSGEIAIPSTSCGFGLDVEADEDDFKWRVCFPPIALYFAVSAPPLHRIARWLLTLDKSIKARSYEGRELGVRIFNNAIWWDVWHPDGGWDSTTPRWRHGCWHPVDTFLGREKVTWESLRKIDVEVPMPEGVYYGLVEMKRGTWQRPRWFPKVHYCADLKMAEGQAVPCPGKGENSWDCGEDASYGIHCFARTPGEAVAALVASVLRSRERHGGRRWRPTKGPYGATAIAMGDALRAVQGVLIDDRSSAEVSS